ncbi:hypothetical protein [Streptomyces adustus]|uniref:hypothetical protein n=1 Tax=Streptomyces adustus TaxID=1609272 RepID=UPI00371E3EC5
MRFRAQPSPAAAEMRTRTSDDLQNEYRLISRERQGGHNSLAAIADQNDIARELESRERK